VRENGHYALQTPSTTRRLLKKNKKNLRGVPLERKKVKAVEICKSEAKRIIEPAEVNKSTQEKRESSPELVRHTSGMGDRRYDNAAQHLNGRSKLDRETARIYVHRRKNPAARAARATVTPDLVTEAAPFRLEATLVPVEVGEETTVLVTLEGLAGLEP